MQSPPKIPQPLNCVLWRDERLENINELLETTETYLDDSHDRRCLLKCRECGHLYFYKFLEFIDYADGEDHNTGHIFPWHPRQTERCIHVCQHGT